MARFGNKEHLLLHNSPQGILCRTGHRIRLVQDNQLKPTQHPLPRSPPGSPSEDLLCTCKRFDLLPYHLNPSVIRRIQLKHLLPDILCAVDMTRERENSGCLSGAWGAIEEEVREAVGFDEFVNWMWSAELVVGNV